MDCTGNQVSAANSPKCRTCPATTEPKTDSSGCKPTECPVGEGLNDDEDACVGCGLTEASAADSNVCTDCAQSGQVPNADKSACEDPPTPPGP